MDIRQISDQKMDLVAVGAHPDDVEILCGGTLAKLSEQGLRCGIIDLTNAEPTPANEKYRSPDDFDPDYDHKRLAEARNAAAILGVADRVTLDLSNRRLMDGFEERCLLASVFRRWRPRIVMVMYGKTVMASPDHYQTQLITEAAIFYARLTKWEKYFHGLPVHHVRQLLYFPVAAQSIHPEGESGRLTSFFMDISSVVEKKQQAILAYRSQFEVQGKEKFVDRILERNRSIGLLSGVDYAEHLATPAPLIVNDLSMFG